MNKLLYKELEAEMLSASAKLWLRELIASKSEEYLEAFYDGYMFRSGIISRLAEIYFGGDYDRIQHQHI